MTTASTRRTAPAATTIGPPLATSPAITEAPSAAVVEAFVRLGLIETHAVFAVAPLFVAARDSAQRRSRVDRFNANSMKAYNTRHFLQR